MQSRPAWHLLALLMLCLSAKTAYGFGQGGRPTDLELAMPQMTRLAADVWVGRLAPGLWVHTTTSRLSDGTIYPANGMLLETRHGSVLVDTGWNPAQTNVLLSWARHTLHHPVREAFVTHFHSDRLGGTPALARMHIPVYGLGLTRRLAIQHGRLNPPEEILHLETRPYKSPEGFEVFYPGPGHTQDNIVVYFPKSRLLFGGCFLKSVTETDLGNLADADLAKWPASLRQLRDAYPAAKCIVPGHGTCAGNASDHTLAMLTAHH